MSNNKDKMEKIQIKLAGMSAACVVVYFWLLERLKPGLGAWYPIVQQLVACLMILLVISSGWKFVEILFKGRSNIGSSIKKIIEPHSEKEEDEEKD